MGKGKSSISNSKRRKSENNKNHANNKNNKLDTSSLIYELEQTPDALFASFLKSQQNGDEEAVDLSINCTKEKVFQ
eukprot:Pgem_evm1s12640